MRRIAIVGCGLIGGSIALATGERIPGTEVSVLDRGDPLDRVREADLIVLAAPIAAILDLLESLRPIVTPRSLITDTGSTKARIVGAARGLRFIGGHPVAGSTGSGRAAARADLFVGRPWVLTPGEGASAEDVRALQVFVETLGAHAQLLGAAEHDHLFAFISHLPQLAVSALMEVVGSAVGAEGLAAAGTGLRDTTRLAASPPEIWREIARTNPAHLSAAIDAMVAALTRLRDDVNGSALDTTFEAARRWKAVLDTTARNRPI